MTPYLCTSSVCQIRVGTDLLHLDTIHGSVGIENSNIGEESKVMLVPCIGAIAHS